MINKILKALKAVDIYSISPFDYEQEDKIKEVVLSVTGLSENDPYFEPFISKLVNKLGLYDGDPEDNAEVLAWETALKLRLIEQFVGWNPSIIEYEDIKYEADSEYFEDDYSVIKSYLEQHGVTIVNEPDSYDETDLISLWNKLVEFGYSKGDIINSDDISEASDELGMDFDEAMDLIDELEETYDVSVMSNDMLAGDGPGSYYETDSSADERMIDDIEMFDLESEFNVTILPPEQIIGDGPGNYEADEDD